MWQFQGCRLVIGMVGLPARGKSYISLKLKNFIRWLGVEAELFNIGCYRRKEIGSSSHEFFDPESQANLALRQSIAEECLKDMLNYMESKTEALAIFDGTNSRRVRRDKVSSACKKAGLSLLWIESICDDEAKVNENIFSCKVSSEDYVDRSVEEAYKDFLLRIENYRKQYQQLSEDEGPFLKIINVCQGYNIQGQLTEAMRVVVEYVMSLRGYSGREIYLTRHGESEYNIEEVLGGDPPLTAKGKEQAKFLKYYFDSHAKQPLVVSSTMLRARQTAQIITDKPVIQFKELDEISAGIMDGMRLSQIKSLHSEIHQRREADKFNVSFPRGESYRDLVRRLVRVVQWLERQTRKTVVVVGHRGVNRALAGYLYSVYGEELTRLKFPLNYMVKFSEERKKYSYEELHFPDTVQFYRKMSINWEDEFSQEMMQQL